MRGDGGRGSCGFQPMSTDMYLEPKKLEIYLHISPSVRVSSYFALGASECASSDKSSKIYDIS
jgi:hypothetical protein